MISIVDHCEVLVTGDFINDETSVIERRMLYHTVKTRATLGGVLADNAVILSL
jgi:hypothetical protein